MEFAKRTPVEIFSILRLPQGYSAFVRIRMILSSHGYVVKPHFTPPIAHGLVAPPQQMTARPVVAHITAPRTTTSAVSAHAAFIAPFTAALVGACGIEISQRDMPDAVGASIVRQHLLDHQF